MSDTAVNLDLRPGGAKSSPMDAKPVTPLDAIRSRLQRVQPGKTTLEVPTRPGFGVVYSLALDGPHLQAWLEAADEDMFLFHRTVLAQQCIGMKVDGSELVGTDGEPITFKHLELQQMVQCSEATEAVKNFYGNDFHIRQAQDKVCALAGFTGEAKVMDPTPGPS